MTHTKYFNVEEQIKNSDSKLLKRIPDFAIALIKKIVYEDEVNRIINDYSDYEGADFLTKALEDQEITIEYEGLENLPENSKCFFVANHPFGLLDSCILNSTVGKHYEEHKALGNEIFHYIPNLKSLIVKVNVFGKSSRDLIVEINKVYASDMPITHFPYGIVSRIHKFKIQDKMWKKSFIKKAISNKRDIVPIRIYGRNSYLFYSVYLIRQLFGIKANLELILLPRELFRKKGSTVRVKIHPVIHFQDLDRSKTHQEWAEEIRSSIYQN